MPQTPAERARVEAFHQAQQAQISEMARTGRPMRGIEMEEPPRNAAAITEQRKADQRMAAFIPAMSEHRAEMQAAREAKSAERLYDRAFDSFLRHGLGRMPLTQRRVLETRQRELSQQEQRDLGVATGGVGGYLVPQAFFTRIVASMKLVGGVRNAAYVYRTDTGGAMPVPQTNDTTNIGELLSENTQATILDTTLTSKTLGAFTYSSKIVKASLSLIQDSAFDVDIWLAHALGIRLARIQNQHLTTGTGIGQPQGLFTASAVGKTGLTGQTTSVIYDDLVDLVHAVDPFYRGGKQLLKGFDTTDAPDMSLGPNPVFMMNDASLQKVAKLKDTQGRPLYQAGLTASAPDTILGYPVVINLDAPTMAAGARSIFFGDASSYLVREAGDISLLMMTERYADSLEVGYLAWHRLDGALVGPATSTAVYVNSAS